MQSLEFHQVEAVIANAQMRIEKHGKKERKPAQTLRVSITGNNELLDRFEPGLSKTFFRKAKKGQEPHKGELGEQQELVEGADALVKLKHPVIGSLPITFKGEGYEFEIDPANEGEDPFFQADVKVDNCLAEMFEGGSVKVSMTLSYPSEYEDATPIHKLWAREKVMFTLTPPSKQEGGQDGCDGAPDPDTDPSKRNP